jgi:uncharacterized protein with NRDE domain
MCLIAIALNASEELPLVIAANRDEDYERPSLRAHLWPAPPPTLGGRDLTHGGSWLAISASGRFAAITNLRGAVTSGRSRGLLVRDFVQNPAIDASHVLAEGDAYAGFHLVAGEIGGPAFLLSNADRSVTRWTSGIHGVSNAPPGLPWPKVTTAVEQMRAVLSASQSRDAIVRELLGFLSKPGADAAVRGSTLREEAESDVFVIGDRYGTRSSTVIVASADEISLTEQVYGRGGTREGVPVELRARRLTDRQ